MNIQTLNAKARELREEVRPVRNSSKVPSVKALDALNKIRALSIAAQFLCDSDIEDECRIDLLNIIEDICTRVTDAELKK